MKTKLALLTVITGLSFALPALQAQDAPTPPPAGGDAGQGGGCQGHHGGHHHKGGDKPSPSPSAAN